MIVVNIGAVLIVFKVLLKKLFASNLLLFILVLVDMIQCVTAVV